MYVLLGVATILCYAIFIEGVYILMGQAELRIAIDRLEAAVARIVPPAGVDLSAEVARVEAASAAIEAVFPPA